MTRTLGGRELLLRTSSGLDLIQWRSPGGIQIHDVGRHLLELPIIEGDPIRVGGQWQNRPNQHGLYFWQRTGQHIWYESALEAARLVALDQAGEVDKIAAQPFRLLFHTDAKSVRHDPDFFAVHRNGDQVVYDVNAGMDGAWITRDDWEQTIVPLILETIPRGTEGYTLRWSCAITPSSKEA